MAKVIGNTVGVPNPQPDWNQNDATKADFIKNKPTKLSQFENDCDFATSGAVVATKDQLPTDASIGVIHEVGGTVTADYPIKLVTGKIDDIFGGYPDYLNSVYLKGALDITCIPPVNEEFEKYVVLEETHINYYYAFTHIYNADDGSYVGYFPLEGLAGLGDHTGGSGADIHGFKYEDNPDSVQDNDNVISFYICAHKDANIVISEDTVYFNGTEWVELPTMEQVNEKASNEALNATNKKIEELKFSVSTENPETLVVNTIYNLGLQTSLELNLPSGAIGNFIQVDFLSGEIPTTLVITSANGLSEYNLVPEADTIYSLYFDWGVLYYDAEASRYVYGWRFGYAEYVASEV